MQVKKFEARTMKEALEMVKLQLGPDAIILSAKEIAKNFGLGGERSIEITAAYSERILQNKKFVESKFRDKDREAFQKSSAKNQKQVMQKVIESQVARLNEQATTQSPVVPYRLTEKRYIEIDSPSRAEPSTELQTTNLIAANDEVISLKKEIESLKKLMSQWQAVPQSFVQAHPGAEHGLHYAISGLYKDLQKRGIANEVAINLLLRCQKEMSVEQLQNRQRAESWVVRTMLEEIPIVGEATETFHLFLGPSGSGKTSSMIKFASDLILNHRKRVALITTDTSKVGAVEQMKIFSQILNVPFLTIKNEQQWAHVTSHLNQLDHVLVDYAGFNLRSEAEIRYLRQISPRIYGSLRSHLVLSAMAKDSDLLECTHRYESFGVDDVIFTALDEASLHGNIFNLVAATQKPLFGFGIGQKVPDDFERATAERVVDLIFKISSTHTMKEEQL